MFDFYSKPRIILVGRSQKDARRLIEAFDERFDVRYVEEVSDEYSRFSDAMVFDYVGEDIIRNLRSGSIPYLCLIGSEKAIVKYSLEPGEYLLKGPGYLHYLPEIVYSMLEKHRLQKTLDFEREKYMGLVNSMGCGMLILRKRDGNVIFCNQVAQSLLGYTEEEIEKMRLQDLVYDEPFALETILGIEHFDTDREIVMLTKTGGKTYVIFNTSEMLYGAESVVQLTFMDVSKQKRDREELIFQWRFLDNAEEIAIAIDEKGRIVYLNKFAAEIHGYNLEEMLGDNLASYLVQGEGEAEFMQFSMMKSGKWKGRQLHRRRDGTEFIVEAKRSMLRVDDNVYELVIGIDVTENIELQRRNNLHSLLLNGTGDLAIATDMENRLIYLNEAAEKYFETRLEDEENKALEDISSEPLRNFLKIAASKPSEPLENKIRFPVRQESNAVIEFTGEIVRDHDEEVGTIFIGRKVT
ncbi:MAG: hypothetical protein PWQ24_1264 [Mesotoga sp.]|nr:hypothetical protein [Mesotoga sp.]